jgi:hypothetical protein
LLEKLMAKLIKSPKMQQPKETTAHLTLLLSHRSILSCRGGKINT